MRGAVLITGADGYVGRLVAGRLLQTTDRPILAWVHATDADTLARKRARLEHALGETRRLRVLGGDLRDAAPFAAVSPAEVDLIVHAAAVTRFNVEADVAEAVNHQGTRKLLALAARCPRVERVCVLSTIYASGLRAGAVPEAPLDEAPFANHYEASKWRAEQATFDVIAERGLPACVLRLPTVIADNSAGVVSQRNAFHNTLRLLWGGLLSVLPGAAGAPLYFTTGDFAARATAALALAERVRPVHHLCHGRTDAITLSALVDEAVAAFETDAGYKERRLPRPLLADRETFDLLAAALAGVSTTMAGQALRTIVPFAPQLYVHKDVAAGNAAAALAGAAPAAPPLVRAVAHHLVRARFTSRDVA